MSLDLTVIGNLGNIEGPASDGVLIGEITPANPTKVLLKSLTTLGLCYTDDGGTYVDETVAFANATADDVEILPATPAAQDACYFGHATHTFDEIIIVQTTQGVGTWTIVWEYWNGSAWTAVTGLTDGTTGFTSAVATVSVTFTEPTDWEKCQIDNVNAYWVRGRVSVYSAVTTAPEAGQGWVVPVNPFWTDDTTDFTDVGAGDVELLPLKPTEGDGLYIGYSGKFCKIKITTSQAATGTHVLTLKYWDGSAWSAVDTVEDDSVAYSEAAGTYYIHFTPPTDWVANTAANGPDGNTGYFVAMELTDLTDVTQQPLGTQGWILPIKKPGVNGVRAGIAGTHLNVSMMAGTISGTTANSTFLIVNATQGTYAEIVWTKAEAMEIETATLAFQQNDQILIVQITEDGTTEFADATFNINFS